MLGEQPKGGEAEKVVRLRFSQKGGSYSIRSLGKKAIRHEKIRGSKETPERHLKGGRWKKNSTCDYISRSLNATCGTKW